MRCEHCGDDEFVYGSLDIDSKGRCFNCRNTLSRKPIVKVLLRTGGWKVRQKMGTLIEECRCSFSAGQIYEDKKDWLGMLVEIEDGIKASKALAKLIRDKGNL